MDLEQELLSQYFVKVYKNPDRHDDRTLLCGSEVMKDRHGEYFVIPAHAAGYISRIFPQYEVGKPFIPKPEKKGAPAIEEEE